MRRMPPSWISCHMKTVFRVFSYLKRYPLLATAQLTCAVFMTLLVVVFPSVAQTITGEVIPQRDFDRLIPLALLAVGTFFATNLFNSLRIILNNTFEQKVIFDIRSDLYRKIQRLPMRWFDAHRVATGKPPEAGGVSGRGQAGGLGLVEVLREMLPDMGMELEGLTFTVAGFGKVGRSTATALCRAGARLVGVLDRSGAVLSPRGIDPALLSDHLDAHD